MISEAAKSPKKGINDYLSVNTRGVITANGKENPTDQEIADAVRAFAKVHGKEANSIKTNDRFELARPNPMISHNKGTQMTKQEWMDEYGWSEDEFEVRRTSGILIKR